MHPWMNDVNVGCFATREGPTKKISDFQEGFESTTSVTPIGSMKKFLHPLRSNHHLHHSSAGAFNAIPSFIHQVEGKSPCLARSASGLFCVKNNPVRRHSSPGIVVAQWFGHPTGVAEVVGSIPT